MQNDPYKTLGVDPSAKTSEIKNAYRALVKKHHPDAGGDEKKILEINAAWEIISNPINRKAFDLANNYKTSSINESHIRGVRNAHASAAARAAKENAEKSEDSLIIWLKKVYKPIDKLLGDVINPFPRKLKALSADPYDDLLMEAFCDYLKQSQRHLEKVDAIYQSIPTPNSIRNFGLNLYHCLSQVKDAISELERYTMGYVDNYLHDGKEMLFKAKQQRSFLKEERKRFNIS